MFGYCFPNNSHVAYFIILMGEGIPYSLNTLKDIVRTFRWR